MTIRHHVLNGRNVYRLSGADGRDLLQRISTADMTPLAQGLPVATLLTNEKGRVVDLIGVVPRSDGSLIVAGIGDVDGRVAGWLGRFIIMEDVTVTDVSSDFTSTVLYGIGADGRWVIPDIGSAAGSLVPVSTGRHQWGLAIVPRGHSVSGATLVDDETFAHDRIVAGIPWTPNEIGERRHPLEARLRSLISFTKGCYVGQEVVARLDAYRKVSMALTRFEGLLTTEESAPIVLTTHDGIEGGIVTSVAAFPTGTRALGFVKMDLLASALKTPAGTVLRPVDIDSHQGIYD